MKADRENKDAQVKEIKRFYVKVPDLVAHTNHPSGEVCGVGQAVDSSIIEKIHEPVAAGETHAVSNTNKYSTCTVIPTSLQNNLKYTGDLIVQNINMQTFVLLYSSNTVARSC